MRAKHLQGQRKSGPSVLPDELDPLPDGGLIESLAAASPETLQALMLARMSAAANLKKEIGLLIGEVAERIADAKICELLLHQKARKRNGDGQ